MLKALIEMVRRRHASHAPKSGSVGELLHSDLRSRLHALLRPELAQYPGHRLDLGAETRDLLTRGVEIASETRGDESGPLKRIRELLDGVLFMVRKRHCDVLRCASTVVLSRLHPIMQNAHQLERADLCENRESVPSDE